MSEWTYKSLPELISFVVDNRGRTAPTAVNGIPLIATNCISDSNLFPEYKNVRYVSQNTYDTWFRSHPIPGDIIFVNKGTPGLVAMVPDPVDFCFAQDMVALRPAEKVIDGKYLFAVLRSFNFKEQVKNYSVGTTIPHLKKSDFPKLSIPVPPRNVQEKIGRIYYQLSLKIEVNRRINRTLEAMAQALFQHHFVDFGPYQAELVESEAGLIPRGWGVAPLSSHIKVAKGLSYKGQWLANEGMPLHNLNSIYEGGGYKYEGIKFYVGEYQERHTVKPGNLIVANTEQGFDYLLIGCPAIVPKRFGEIGLFTHHIYKVELLPDSPLTTHYVYFWTKNPQLRQAVTAFTNGTTVNMLSRDGLQIPLMVIPPSEIVQSFNRVVSNITRQIEHNEDENRKLAEIRDYLLPRLLSGEIVV